MNETFTHRVIITLLVLLVILTGVSMYAVNSQLNSIAQSLQTSTRSTLNQACVSSGGEWQNGACVCERDYFLENGMCMGQDGMTAKELNEVKIGQERLMQVSGDTDRGMPNPEVSVGGLTFEIPPEWRVVSRTEDTIKINVPDPKYQVVIPLTVRAESAVDANRIRGGGYLNNRLFTTPSGAVVYGNVTAPSLYSAYIDYKGKLYDVVFEEPTSNEPVPANLDGVWFPRTIVTDAEMINVLTSVR